MPARAFITGLSGLAVTPEERAFLRETCPWGLILFKRNVADKAQVTRLVQNLAGNAVKFTPSGKVATRATKAGSRNGARRPIIPRSALRPSGR